MSRLGLKPGRDVGEALSFLLELRLEEGPLGDEEAARRLDAWWADRQASRSGSARLRALFPSPDDQGPWVPSPSPAARTARGEVAWARAR